jgi:prevent-host-death family protein
MLAWIMWRNNTHLCQRTREDVTNPAQTRLASGGPCSAAAARCRRRRPAALTIALGLDSGWRRRPRPSAAEQRRVLREERIRPPTSHGATVTHMANVVGVRELRQNLSRYLDRVKAGEGFIVTERGEEVARLTPSARHETTLAQLIAERGASIPRGDLLQTLALPETPAQGPPSTDVLDELREERL